MSMESYFDQSLKQVSTGKQEQPDPNAYLTTLDSTEEYIQERKQYMIGGHFQNKTKSSKMMENMNDPIN